MRRALLIAPVVLAVAAAPALAQDGQTRPAGSTYSWAHEIYQNALPNWDPDAARAPIAPRRWLPLVDRTLRRSGQNGLWFTGASSLPFRIPLGDLEPSGWRTPANFARQNRRTGLKWDANLDIWTARNVLGRKRPYVNNPRTLAWARRASLLDPAYLKDGIRETRRIVRSVRNRPYLSQYTGADEPIVFLPSGRKANRSGYAKRLRAAVKKDYGQPLPRWNARKTRSLDERLKWVAYSRYVSDKYLDFKERQAKLVKRLDPDGVFNPNDYAFIDGFMPWDYTRLADFADVVENDPYTSKVEREVAGRGRYNHGFGAKFLGDLTGKRVRTVVQAFEHGGYQPEGGDLWTWTAQALRAGGTDISLFASGNPRATNPKLYRQMLGVAKAMRGATLPAKPQDPATLVLYSMMTEAQARPHLGDGGARYKTGGDELYATYALLGELGKGAFNFEADTRIGREPERLGQARTLWLPRAEILERPVAEQIANWVRGGGTLIVTDPNAFSYEPNGEELADVRSALVGASLTERTDSNLIQVDADAIGEGVPDDDMFVPVLGRDRYAFASVPAGASVVARFIDGRPAAVLRQVGQGRVLAFSAQIMRPESLSVPQDLITLVQSIHRWSGGATDHPAWGYRLPGDPEPDRLPWEGAYDETPVVEEE